MGFQIWILILCGLQLIAIAIIGYKVYIDNPTKAAGPKYWLVTYMLNHEEGIRYGNVVVNSVLEGLRAKDISTSIQTKENIIQLNSDLNFVVLNLYKFDNWEEAKHYEKI